MPARYKPDRRTRVPAALAAVTVQAALAYLLVSGLAPRLVGEVSRRLEVIGIPMPSPSPTPTPTSSPSPRPKLDEAAPKDEEGAAGRRGEATQIVAPPTRLILVPPPPIVTATRAGTGNDQTTGAADTGQGTGAGGTGFGRGGGGSGGSGTGRGGQPAQRVAGALRDSDYPEAAAETQTSGTVFIRFRVGLDGRVRGCEVTRSSGSPILDETTCRLVERRFRYRPARDETGRAVESNESTNFTWGMRFR